MLLLLLLSRTLSMRPSGPSSICAAAVRACKCVCVCVFVAVCACVGRYVVYWSTNYLCGSWNSSPVSTSRNSSSLRKLTERRRLSPAEVTSNCELLGFRLLSDEDIDAWFWFWFWFGLGFRLWFWYWYWFWFWLWVCGAPGVPSLAELELSPPRGRRSINCVKRFWRLWLVFMWMLLLFGLRWAIKYHQCIINIIGIIIISISSRRNRSREQKSDTSEVKKWQKVGYTRVCYICTLPKWMDIYGFWGIYIFFYIYISIYICTYLNCIPGHLMRVFFVSFRFIWFRSERGSSFYCLKRLGCIYI